MKRSSNLNARRGRKHGRRQATEDEDGEELEEEEEEDAEEEEEEEEEKEEEEEGVGRRQEPEQSCARAITAAPAPIHWVQVQGARLVAIWVRPRPGREGGRAGGREGG